MNPKHLPRPEPRHFKIALSLTRSEFAEIERWCASDTQPHRGVALPLSVVCRNRLLAVIRPRSGRHFEDTAHARKEASTDARSE